MRQRDRETGFWRAALLCAVVVAAAACGGGGTERDGGTDAAADTDATAADAGDARDTPAERDAVETAETAGDPDAAADPDSPEEIVMPAGLVWIAIAGGTFDMGCSPNDTNCNLHEEPRHTVTVAAFEITETEITQAQYQAMMGTNPSHFTGCDACPVEQVRYAQAQGFCESIGARLPSEAEWEYAARGGSTMKYVCGEDTTCLDAFAWYNDNSGDATHAAKGKGANAFLLYDVLGNVAEWVEDCWHYSYEGAPSTGEVWSGGDCLSHVLRGGHYTSRASDFSVSRRASMESSGKSMNTGFRCAR